MSSSERLETKSSSSERSSIKEKAIQERMTIAELKSEHSDRRREQHNIRLS